MSDVNVCRMPSKKSARAGIGAKVPSASTLSPNTAAMPRATEGHRSIVFVAIVDGS
jgi:hypothetical protein